MAIERNMAEGASPGPEITPAGSQAGPQRSALEEEILKLPVQSRIKYVTSLPPDQGAEAMKVLKLEVAGGADDEPDWLKEAKEKSQTSSFSERVTVMTKAMNDYGVLSRIDPATVAGHEDEFKEILQKAKEAGDTSNTAVNELLNEAIDAGALDRVQDDLKALYKDIKTRYDLKSSPLGDRLDYVHRAAARYTETFWDIDSNLRLQRGKYEGAGQYLFKRVCVAIEKDLRRIAPNPAEVGDLVFMDIKEERERERMREPKFQKEARSWYTEFHWAEKEEDIIPSVQDWLLATIKEIPKSRRDQIQKYLDGKHSEGSDMLSRLRLRLNQEGMTIAEDNPTYIKARTLMESQLNILGGERVLFRGGFDYYINYLDNFSNDFTTKELNGHYDVVYLSDEMIPLMLDQLSAEEGKYWRGCENTEEKPSEGRIKAFQANRQGEIEGFALTHRLFINKNDFNDRDIGFGDKIGKLLLDLDNEAERLEQAGNTAGVARIKIRRAVFRRIRDRLDAQEGLYSTAGFTGLSEEQKEAQVKQLREEAIRERIIKQMEVILPNFDRNTLPLNDQLKLNQVLWKWVEDYNRYNQSSDRPEWFPSKWDKVRWNIKEPEKLLGRGLTKEELRAMYIETDASGYTVEEINQRTEEIRQKPGLTQRQIQKRLENFRSELQARREDRLERAKNNFTLARGAQIFFGLASRYGGTRIRHTDAYGKFQSFKPVFVEFRDRLKKMIDDEAAAITAGRLKKEDAVFLATHALREVGMANNLPVWSFQMVGDESSINRFAQILAGYGVKIGSGAGVALSHDDKEDLYDVFERARRKMKEVKDQMAKEFMDGRFTIKDAAGNPILGKNGKPITRRIRLNHKGGNVDLRKIFDAQYMISTSGGVALPEMISQIADLGVYDLAWEMGCEDLRELSGYIYRRDESESEDQSLFDVLDAPNYKDRLAGAEAARKALVGGSVGDNRFKGLLKEPLSGAFRIRDFLYTNNNWENKEVRPGGDIRDEEQLTTIAKDELMKLCGEVIKPLKDYMETRKYVENRIGRACRTWEYDNTLIWYVYKNELMKRVAIEDKHGKLVNAGGEILGKANLDYAIQARGKLAIKYMLANLDADYQILFPRERKALAKEGLEPFATEEGEN